MKTSTLILGYLIVLTVTVLSAPIQDRDDQGVAPHQLGMVLGFYGIVSAATLGVMALGTVFRGLVKNWTNRKFVSHIFEELKKYEAEKAAAGGAGGIERFTKTPGQQGNWKEINGDKPAEDKEDERVT
jgi:hypothetical protein